MPRSQEKYRTIPQPQQTLQSLQDSVLALKEVVDVLTGKRGPDDGHAVNKGYLGRAGDGYVLAFDKYGDRWVGTEPSVIGVGFDLGELIDNTGGTADDTVEALPDPAGPLAGDAETLRLYLVNTLLPALRNDYADIIGKLNAILGALASAGVTPPGSGPDDEAEFLLIYG